MSTHTRRIAPLLVTAALTAALVVPTAAFARVDEASLLARRAAPVHAAATAPATTPTAAPVTADAGLAADLAFMREEERLAHDVYTKLADLWGSRVFTNIASSEQKHTDSIAALMKTYGVADPTVGLDAGEYKNAELQALYNDLVAKGSVSVEAAFEVGKLIEEVDIEDLDERIARTDESDVVAVYKNLRAASVNHLAAFERQLSGTAGGGAGRGNGTGGGRGMGMGRGAE